MGRTLTEDEKKKVWEYAMDQAKAANPNSYVSIRVYDELDDSGNARWKTFITTEVSGPLER